MLSGYDGEARDVRFFVIAAVSMLVCASAYAQSGEDIVIGKKVKMQSKVLGKEIHLSVHLPEGYEDADDKYPVLYLFQAHFEQTAGALKNLYDYNLMPRSICVRIDNYEFGYLTPTPIEGDPNSGQADRFLDFFDAELFPFVAANYRVHDYRIVFSNSWGAAFIVYAMLTRPGLFQAGVASIPWVNYENQNRFLMDNAARIIRSTQYRKNFLYIAMDNERDLLPDIETFVGLLRDNPRTGLEWEYHHWPEEDHTSTPYRAIYGGLRALFGPWREIPGEIARGGLKEIKAYEVLLNERYGYGVGVSTFALRQAGNELKKANNRAEAISVFEYEIEKNPENAFAYVNLGRACEEYDRLDSAKAAYETAYRIAVASSHPQVEWVKGFLDAINRKLDGGR